MLKEFFAEFQDGIDTPQLRGHTEAESISTDEIRGIADVVLAPSMSVAEMQSRIDEAGTGSTIWADPGSYSLSAGLTVPDSITLYWLNSNVTFTDTTAGATMLSNEDTGKGNDDLSFIFHGSTFDGDKANVAVTDTQDGLQIGGGNDDQTNTDYYCHRPTVRGGRFTGFTRFGVRLFRCLAFDVDIREADNCGTGSIEGDGVYVLHSKDGTIDCDSAHDNSRHGISAQGEQAGTRNINVEFSGHCEDNANDGFGIFGVEDYLIQGTATDNADKGVQAIGTGKIDVTVDGSGTVGVYATVQDYSGLTSDITGETSDAQSVRIDATVRNTGGNGIQVFSGSGGTPADTTATIAANLKNIGGIGIYNSDLSTMVVESVNADGVDRQAVYLGNNTAIDGGAVLGGEIRNFNRDNANLAAIADGNNLGDGHVVTGVTTTGGNGQPAVRIQNGDYHSVTGVASRGDGVSVAGANSVTAGNS